MTAPTRVYVLSREIYFQMSKAKVANAFYKQYFDELYYRLMVHKPSSLPRKDRSK